MTAVAASKPAPWARLSWIVLVLAWIALLPYVGADTRDERGRDRER